MMTICCFVQDYKIEPRDGKTLVTFRSKGDHLTSFSSLVERLFPEFRLTVIESKGIDWVNSCNSEKVSLDGVNEEGGARLINFLDLMSTTLTIEDELDESHALALHRVPNENGEFPRTEIGNLAYRAKDYYGQAAFADIKAARDICDHVENFITKHPGYAIAGLIAPAPSSNSKRAMSLPTAVTNTVARRVQKRLVLPVRHRDTPSMKDYDEAQSGLTRAEAQANSVQFSERLDGQSIIIIDDLYQTGGTLKEVARAAREAINIL